MALHLSSIGLYISSFLDYLSYIKCFVKRELSYVFFNVFCNMFTFFFFILPPILLFPLYYTRIRVLLSFKIFIHPFFFSALLCCPLPYSGFLQITPEGSPRAQRKGEVGGEVDVSGSFCFHTSGQEFATQQLSDEHQASCSKEATVTMVTRTTRITQQQVTAETISDESLVANTETHQLTGDQL